MDCYGPSLLDETLYYADGQILDEVYVYGSFLQSRMYHEGIRCGLPPDISYGGRGVRLAVNLKT